MLTKPRDPLNSQSISLYVRKRRRFSPLMLIGVSIPVLLALIAGVVLIALPHFQSHAANAVVNMDCTLTVPANPLSARGLATPYQLVATNAGNGPCHEANANQGAFVQGVIYDPATGKFSVYSPLVIDQNTQPAVVPVTPTLPPHAVVGLWFGFNGANLTLKGSGARNLAQARCVNGLNQSIFGQFAYCNAPAFFAAAQRGIAAGKVQVPGLGMAKDGLPCPTMRDFSVVDQDQSDNVQTQYLATANGQTAQLSAANQAQLQNATRLGNPSDNALLTTFIDPALGCQPWQAPNIADNNTMVSALPLDELQAAMDQQAPIAQVPATDPMVLVNNNASLTKTNRYREGVNQMPAGSMRQASGTTYCGNLVQTGLPRIQKDMPLTINATTPAADAANSLFTFLASRFMQSYTNLNCAALLKQPNPVTVQTDGNGVVTAATVTLPGTTGNGGGQQTATGTANINLNSRAGNADMMVKLAYPNHPNQRINVNLATGSCTNQPFFTQVEHTDGQGNSNANVVIKNLQNVKTLPTSWFLSVTDPNLKNANGQPTIVGCGAVTATGITGNATLGAISGTGNGNSQATPVATPAATPVVTPPASAGQNTPTNGPYRGRRHHRW
ncbi:hypothetical protein [Dictyobacter arantiisoli]|uniref:Uncharacterized protein n=1 Tax=Dictyobacter arantiisoli TaxID=2014874 RepID=A0A5A5T9E6_9CHLR|nr:hypothetical protein [Dictyobacter arantiisoli]GCF08032.1 hypothetical protein KDI_15960 [Dictyobacter arantiisoli]